MGKIGLEQLPELQAAVVEPRSDRTQVGTDYFGYFLVGQSFNVVQHYYCALRVWQLLERSLDYSLLLFEVECLCRRRPRIGKLGYDPEAGLGTFVISGSGLGVVRK